LCCRNSGTEDLRVYLFNKVLEGGTDYSIVNGTKGTDDFYSGGTVTLLNTNNTSNLTYTLSEEKPLYVGRFYNYDNIDELNNNEVEFKASIMLIVSLWAYDSSVLSVTPSNT
jgi:hypothetical protein